MSTATTPADSPSARSGSADRPEGAPLSAEIVTTGTEILLGEIVDTNAAWIAQQLREAGVNLYYKTTVGDNEPRLRGVIELGLSRSDVILVTGGLGPTADDITRQAIANATGRPLVLHEGALAALQERFARFGVPMTENNRQQALIPAGAILIENPVGTAPGFIVETERGTVIALPGVPREMKHLMTETVLPYLRARSGHTGIIRRRILRTVGIGESAIDSRLRDLMDSANPTVGLAAHMGQADVRITARAATADEAEAMLDVLEARIRERIGEFIYSTTPDEPFERAVVSLLQAAGATVAVLESDPPGILARRLSTGLESYQPVSAAWMVGAPDTPEPVQRVLAGLPAPQELSETQVQSVAQALRQATGTTYGLLWLGTAGADEGVFGRTPGKTWLAVAGPGGVTTASVPFGGQDEYTLVRISNQALGVLWQQLRTSS
ncbi:CinA family nicotinamide mononucleotide deamidase-related protein [Litorilinea aerophila]|uniref:CinA-like protein n=1 Tax=Litorilinea aerophila TaxID=1204385 RepID=A0A540VB11_9CHLR|nr:CinA family nicotinamide mononucleotide deamidase-related protein [Litorilinea aerophila]MCC9078227.1 CinA family nicotinamide mononucleotide deamidase-related protein [Litorilinea aerophila]GIV80197.1 MAG: hypothetical protein KatS3mg050_4591 [Litorilinea sp.]